MALKLKNQGGKGYWGKAYNRSSIPGSVIRTQEERLQTYKQCVVFQQKR